MRDRQFGYTLAILAIVIGLMLMVGPLFEVFNGLKNGKVCEVEVNSFPETEDHGNSGRSALYLEGALSGVVAFYAGDKEKEFHIRITEDYNGEEYDGENQGNDQWSNGNIFDATVSIREFRDENGKAISGSGNNPFAGFASGYGSAYNGPDGDGFSFSNRLNNRPNIISG